MTDAERIRLLINDKDTPKHFNDLEIAEFLALAGDSVYLAAALALEAWAGALTGETDSERIGDYSYTKKQAANKLALAERYRKVEAETPVLSWASMDLAGAAEAEE